MRAVFAWWGHRAMIRDRLGCESRHGPRDLGRTAGGRSNTRGTLLLIASGRGSAMRRYLLTTAAAAALLAAMPARAQDATWSTAPGSSDFNTAANWTPATVPTGTAFFGASTITGLTFNPGAANSLGGFTFNAGAPAYSFSLATPSTLTFTGAGIVNNYPNALTFSLTFTAALAFTNSSTAGNAIITNSGTSSVTQFFNSSTAANATITNTSNGFISFNDTSTAGNATITSGSGGFASFLGSSTAGNATLTANFLGFTTFSNSSSAGNATITTNFGGSTSFANSSTAGNATLITNNGGSTLFTNSSTAGNATVITNAGGTTQFSQSSTGGNAAFTTQAGGVFDMSGVIFGMTAGSIAGAGTYFLGSNALAVGGNNLSTTVSGTISDGGLSGGTGGSLVKVGSGTLTLAGTSSYTGATVVTGGTLAVTGDTSSSSGVLVTPGAMLSGTGTVPGLLVAGGTLMPGQSVGTLNVRGNLVFTSAATYLININATTASLTNVSGTATLNGATVQVVDDKDITKRKVYTLLTATGGISGTFNPEVAGAKKKVDLFYDANNVYLCDHCKLEDFAISFSLPRLRLRRRARLSRRARRHVGLCARGRGDRLEHRECARHRAQRRIPGRALWFQALGRRLCVGGAGLCDVLDVDRSLREHFWHRSSHVELHRAQFRRQDRGRLSLRHAGGRGHALRRVSGATLLPSRLQRDRAFGFVNLCADIQFAERGDDAQRARRLVRQNRPRCRYPCRDAVRARRLGARLGQ